MTKRQSIADRLRAKGFPQLSEEQYQANINTLVTTVCFCEETAMTTDLSNKSVEELEDVLIRNGFVRCDIPACNCGSWHPRYGLYERSNEIKDTLAEAGHPLCNENGHIALAALQDLIAERDSLARRLEEAQQKIALAKAEAMEELHAELMARYLGWDEWVLRAIKGKAAEYRAKATEAGRKE